MWDRIRATTAPAGDPITLPEAKAHCRVDASDEDALITRLIGAAVAKIEGPKGLGLAVMERQWALSLHAFPRLVVLPLGPVTAVNEVTYVDTAGAQQTLDTADYHVDLDGEPARIEPSYGKSWPATRDQRGAVTVTFTAGYPDAASIPDDLKTALLMTVAHTYENRESVTVGSRVSEVPDTAKAILERYRAGRFGV